MELDFNTVKALSSRTRIEILNEALSNESTPTDLSEAVGKSKSTVSSHLEKLQEAGLLRKDKVEGRRRVVYKPTDKTKAIINGKNRKVKFSILSSVSTAWIGLGLGLNSFRELFKQQSASATDSDGGQIGAMSMEQGAELSKNAAESGLANLGAEVLLFVSFGLLSISLAGLVYGFVVSRLGR